MDEYLPEKFKKLVGPTFANKDELKKNHSDYYTKKFNFVPWFGKDSNMKVMADMTDAEKMEELAKLMAQGGLNIKDIIIEEEFDEDIQVKNCLRLITDRLII